MQLVFGPKYANSFDDDGDDDNDDDDDSLGALWLMGLRPGADSKAVMHSRARHWHCQEMP